MPHYRGYDNNGEDTMNTQITSRTALAAVAGSFSRSAQEAGHHRAAAGRNGIASDARIE